MQTFSFIADVISVLAAVLTAANTYALFYFGRRVWFKVNEETIVQKFSDFGSQLSRFLVPKPEDGVEIKTLLRRLSSELGALRWTLGGAAGKTVNDLRRMVSDALSHDKIDDGMQSKIEKVYVELSGLETDLRLLAEQKKVSP